ncbi:IS3 family transposase [Ruminococcus sp. RTP21204st1_B2_RTP21204_210225]
MISAIEEYITYYNTRRYQIKLSSLHKLHRLLLVTT